MGEGGEGRRSSSSAERGVGRKREEEEEEEGRREFIWEQGEGQEEGHSGRA